MGITSEGAGEGQVGDTGVIDSVRVTSVMRLAPSGSAHQLHRQGVGIMRLEVIRSVGRFAVQTEKPQCMPTQRVRLFPSRRHAARQRQ